MCWRVAAAAAAASHQASSPSSPSAFSQPNVAMTPIRHRSSCPLPPAAGAAPLLFERGLEPVDHGLVGFGQLHLACAHLGVRRMAAPRAAASGSVRAPAGRPRSTPCLRCSPSSASAPAGRSGTTWRWRNPGGAPPEAIAGDGAFLGPAPGTSTDASAPQRERRCVGNPSRTGPARTIASNPMRDSQMVGPQRKPRR